MKRLAIVLFSFSAGAVALGQGYEAPYGMAGCGLGSIVAKEMGWKNNASQILAATTNGTAYSQTIGITSGTSNCADGGKKVAKLEQSNFIAVNKAKLSLDAARGEGEYLNAMADLFGCRESEQDLELFKKASKESYPAIFGNDSDAEIVREGFIGTIRGNEQLAKVCLRAA